MTDNNKILYRIEACDPAAHLFRVSVTVPAPDASGQLFCMPAWVPGSYMIRDYARNVVAIRAESDGIDVPLEKIDKSTWQAAQTSRALTVTADIFAYDPSVRGAHLDMTHAFFNGTAMFLRVAGAEQLECVVELVSPEIKQAASWRVATSMQRLDAEAYGFGSYRAADFWELIDHPFEIGELTVGEFEALGIPHAIAIRGRHRCDMSRLCHDLQTICEQQLKFLGVPEDLDRYIFLLHATGDGYGGLEHRWSSSLVCSRDSLPFKGQTEVDEAYRTFLGLVSHEYFHLWNVKRIRPAAVGSSDLAAECYTKLLWVFEGITSYYDDLQLYRSGLISQEDYFELLGRIATRVRRGPGRTRQTVSDSSFDAWIKFYKPDENAQNAIVSYYAKGSLIALCLDLKLRVESSGKISLDDVMRASWERYGRDPEGMPEDGFESLCREVSGLDLQNFFDATVRGTGELPLESLLNNHGVRLLSRIPNSRADKGGTAETSDSAPPVTLGAALAEKNGATVFASIANGGAAEAAGVAPGDVAVALDGLKLTPQNIDARLKTFRPGDKAELAVFRGDMLTTLKLRMTAADADTCYLQVDDDASAEADKRRQAWLARES
ncbi:MAG: M61 family metallopeptidase [Woeseiaceae bacterium]|nr:M61 family metallopeptidase [Woeseiaceae bacterium]